jgi:hypothetical protein
MGRHTSFEVAEMLTKEMDGRDLDEEMLSKILDGIVWAETVTIMALKEHFQEDVHYHLWSYLKRLTRHLPHIAGMLAATCGKDWINFHWSDNSGVIRSKSTHPADGKDDDGECITPWTLICSYIYTLYFPKDGLPCWDSTMQKDGDHWNLETSKGNYTGKTVYTASHQSKQTCVFDCEESERIIKDIWVENDGCDYNHEDELLEKAKGTPGIVQIDHSEKVSEYITDPIEGKREKSDLETSGLHSGDSCTLRSILNDRCVPWRTKWRYVLHTKGKPLKSRRTVRQLLKTIYDALQGEIYYESTISLLICHTGHQALYMNKKILHRDVSRANILTEPIHHGLRTRMSYKGKRGNVPYVPIDALLEEVDPYVFS